MLDFLDMNTKRKNTIVIIIKLSCWSRYDEIKKIVVEKTPTEDIIEGVLHIQRHLHPRTAFEA